jgi:hypothetical protein
MTTEAAETRSEPALELERLAEEIKGLALEHRDRIAEMGRKLVEARRLADDQDLNFKEFLEQNWPFSRSYAYECIAVAEGKKTVEQVHARKRNASADHRARRKATRAEVEKRVFALEDENADLKAQATKPVLDRLERAGIVDVTPAREGHVAFVFWAPRELARDHELRKALAEVADRFGVKAEWPEAEQDAESSVKQGAEATEMDAEQGAEPDANSAEQGAEATELAKADDGLDIPPALARHQEDVRQAA